MYYGAYFTTQVHDRDRWLAISAESNCIQNDDKFTVTTLDKSSRAALKPFTSVTLSYTSDSYSGLCVDSNSSVQFWLAAIIFFLGASPVHSSYRKRVINSCVPPSV